MATRITINFNLIRDKFNVIDDDVKKFTHVDFYKKMKDYVPAYTTQLYKNVVINSERIRFKEPYARFIYFGKLMVSPTTGSAWALRGEKKKLTDINLKYSKEVHPLATSNWGTVAWDAKKDEIAKDVKEYIISKRR